MLRKQFYGDKMTIISGALGFKGQFQQHRDVDVNGNIRADTINQQFHIWVCVLLLSDLWELHQVKTNAIRLLTWRLIKWNVYFGNGEVFSIGRLDFSSSVLLASWGFASAHCFRYWTTWTCRNCLASSMGVFPHLKQVKKMVLWILVLLHLSVVTITAIFRKQHHHYYLV